MIPVLPCLQKDKPLAPGCAMLYVPYDRIVRNRAGTVLWDADYRVQEYGLHEHTVAQEVKTICNRHLFDTPVPKMGGIAWKLFCKRMRWLSRELGYVPPTSLTSLIRGRSGRRRRRFRLGVERYLRDGVGLSDSRVTEMQKLEFYSADKLAVKEDRGIQFRSVQYNAALARHLHGIEAKLVGWHGLGYHPLAKGRTPQQRAEMLCWMSSKYVKPKFLCVDHSRFDAHVNLQLLREEHKLYLRCCKYNPELKQLLKWQESNIGYTRSGVKYKVRGKRMSGDINTGLGNTVLNLCMLLAYLDFVGESGHVFLDGDDSVVVVDSKFDDTGLEQFMLDLGMVSEKEVVVDLCKVEFCQSKPVWLPGGVTMVRNPLKVLATMGRSPEKHGPTTGPQVAVASAMCELAVLPGCPIIDPVARNVLRAFDGVKPRKTDKIRYKEETYGFDIGDWNGECVDINAISRFSLYRAWDIPPGMQEIYEYMPIVPMEMSRRAKKHPRVKPDEACDEVCEVEDLSSPGPVCGCGGCPEYVSGELELMRWL